MSDTRDDLYRKRFHIFALVRLFGLAMFLLGIAIAYSDLLRPGGWKLLGGLMAIFGALDAVIAPRLLKKAWEEQDRQGER